MISVLRRLKDFAFPEPIRTANELRRFVSGQASYVAQRSTYEFSRNTLAWFGQAAFGDKTFNEVFAVCRWEAFAGIAADMVVVGRHLLADANDRGQLDAGLVKLYGEILAEYPNPVHRPEGWADRHQTLLSRFAAHPPGRAPDLSALGRVTGVSIHKIAPAKARNAGEERDVLGAAVTFGLVAFRDRAEKLLSVPDMARALATP